MKKRIYLAASVLFLFFLRMEGQKTELIGKPTIGAMGIKVSVADLMKQSAIADQHPKKIKVMREHDAHLHKRPNPDAPIVSQWPVLNGRDSNQINSPGSPQQLEATQTIWSNFLGIDLFSESAFVPPDSNGDIGSTQVCILANGRIKFYGRNTVCQTAQTTPATGSTPLASPAFTSDLDVFFNSVRNGSGITDPHVRFDRNTDRWFIVAVNVASSSNRCVLAVSSGPTISSVSDFTFFFFVFDTISSPPSVPAGYIGGFFDYPTLGVDANALYIGGNMFNSAGTTFFGSTIFIVRKSSVIGVGPIVVTAFHLIGTNTSGIYTPQGVDNDDPGSTSGYFIGSDAGVFSLLDLVRISTPGATPTASSSTLTVPTTVAPIAQKANGTPGAGLDALDDRLFAAMIRKNKISGTSSIWTAHNIEVDATGTGVSGGGRNGSRWYQVDNFSTTPTLTQSGTLFDNAATNPRGYWIPSIAMSGQGHAVLGCSTAGTTLKADCGIAGRYRTDATGSLQTFSFATASITSYHQSGNPERWGDFSQTVVDPLDDMTMWSFQEFCDGTNDWGVRAIQLAAPPPATPTALGTIGCGNAAGPNHSTSVTLNGTSTNNSEFYDPGSSYTNRLSVTTTGSGASISSLVFVSPVQLTFNIVWPSALAGTTQTLTITNPDCQSVTTTYTLPVGCASVPVRWISFTGKPYGRQVQLNWSTSLEPQNQLFTVERRNPDGSFSSIGNVNSQGINGGSYEFFDRNPDEINFYRLKQVNDDQTYTYSVIIRVDLAAISDLLIYPNPAVNEMTIEMPISYRAGVLRIINTKGETVYSAQLANGTRRTVAVNNFPAGIYVVEIENGAGLMIRKPVLIQKDQPVP